MCTPVTDPSRLLELSPLERVSKYVGENRDRLTVLAGEPDNLAVRMDPQSGNVGLFLDWEGNYTASYLIPAHLILRARGDVWASAIEVNLAHAAATRKQAKYHADRG